MLQPLEQLFGRIAPALELQHVVDDSLLPEVIRDEVVTESVRNRLLAHFRSAAEARPDLILSQCSSVGEVADAAALLLPVPVVRIDEAMARQAIRSGPRITVLATLATTLGPSARLIERLARAAGAEVTIRSRVVAEAFEAFSHNDRHLHDRLVAAAIREAASDADVLVCAQGSMATAIEGDQLGGVRVLSSPELAVRDIARRLTGPTGNGAASI